MGNKKRKNISWYLPIACMFMLLLTSTLGVAGSPKTSTSLLVLPPGMTSSIGTQPSLEPVPNGFPDPLGFFDNHQWRQSQVVVTPYYTGNHLAGTTESFLLYFPMSLDVYSLTLTGSIVYIFDDYTTYTVPWDMWVKWWSETITPPVILPLIISRYWTTKVCRCIIYDVDYCEDGIFIRHISKTFTNLNIPEMEPVFKKFSGFPLSPIVAGAGSGTGSALE